MKALMLIPMIAGNRVKLSADRCNINIRSTDKKHCFDFENLIHEYPLHMEDGFERAVAIILLHLVAGHHS